jgi:hypothetical protein
MSVESKPQKRSRSILLIGTNGPKDSREESSSAFGAAVRAVWPQKPALNLAQRAGISERGAQYLIDGKRKPSARAVHAVNSAFFE